MLPEWLFRHRYNLLIVSLFILVYCNLYGWLYVPFVPFQFNWRPDHRLHVSLVSPDSIAAPFLEQGDQILALNGRPVHRSTLFFPPEATQSTYDLTIQRADLTFVETVPYLPQADSYAYQLRLAAGILSLVCWVVGAVVLRFSWRGHQQAIFLGHIFILMSVVVVSWNATLLGVPFAWLTAQPLIFILAAALVYLGILPYYNPLSQHTQVAMRGLFTAAVLVGLVAFIEGLVLFPNDTSVEAIVGISIYKLSAASLAAGGLAMFVLLVIRRIFVGAEYLRQQLNILLMFVGIGFLPAVFLSFVPLAFWDKPILPMPIAILAIVFVPLGYVYVVFRHAYLNLDGTIGRSLPYLLLVFVLTTMHGLPLRLLESRYGGQFDLTLPEVLLFMLLAAIAPAVSERMNSWMHALIFGRNLATQPIIRGYTLDLAHYPDHETLKQVVLDVCTRLNVKRSTLLMKNGARLLHTSAQVGDVSGASKPSIEWLIDTTLLRIVQQRTFDPHPLFKAYAWAEIALPIYAREQLLGVWLLGRPDHGFYHQESIAFLEHAAGTLAMGSEIVFLLDSAERLSRRILAVQDDERRTLATKLHDDPLQRISFIRFTIGHLRRGLGAAAGEPTSTALAKVAKQLGKLESELRELYAMVYPMHLEHGLETTIQKHVEDLANHSEITIQYDAHNLNEANEYEDSDIARIVDHILREAINNILKHSHATHVHISATCEAASLLLTITDNGSAPMLGSLSQSELLRQQHFGIMGMIAWAKQVGGSLKIVSMEDGTQVRLQAPLVVS